MLRPCKFSQPSHAFVVEPDMPRFFFNLTDGDRLDDEEGLELPDADQAIARASDDLRRYAAQVLGDEADLSLSAK